MTTTENCFTHENGHDHVKRTHTENADTLELHRLSFLK